MCSLAPLRASALIAGMVLATLAVADAPGEDPVVVKGTVAAPPPRTGGAEPQSGGFDADPYLPSWLRARITRYQAKAFSANPDGIVTENDVVTTTAAQGIRKACVQDVASNVAPTTPGMKYGPAPTAQVVVLRGDLVNICR